MADHPHALLNRQEAYEAINDPETAAEISSTRDAEVIDMWVPAVSRRIDELCGPVIIRTVTDERHDGGAFSIRLTDSPAATITSVTEYQDGAPYLLEQEQDELLPDYSYILERIAAETFLNRRQGGCDIRFFRGRQNVKVTYEAGRYEDTESVGPTFKMATAAILRRLWSREAGAWARGGDPYGEQLGGGTRFFKTIDPMVKEFLHDELRIPASA